jgi:DNA repair exonuclease SbcCD ATPase subunit
VFGVGLQHVQLEAYEEKMANIQRLVGEIKGSVEGFKIRIEVESKGWRGHMEGIEKELEALKEETDDEILEAKNSIRNELKLKIAEVIADAEKMRKEEKKQVQPSSSKQKLNLCHTSFFCQI